VNRIFTNQQEAQIRKELNILMQCGTAHIMLCDAVPETETDPRWANSVQWFKVTARMPYILRDSQTGKDYTDDKVYEISVGQFIADRNRRVLTSINFNQHGKRRSAA